MRTPDTHAHMLMCMLPYILHPYNFSSCASSPSSAFSAEVCCKPPLPAVLTCQTLQSPSLEVDFLGVFETGEWLNGLISDKSLQVNPRMLPL